MERRAVFVDTTAFVALLDRQDAWHLRAVQIQRGLRGRRLVTSNFVLAETHGFLVSRVGHVLARTFLMKTLSGPTAVAPVSGDDQNAAVGIIMRYQDKAFSLVDATSFAVMERLDIGTAFTFDRHFRQFGFDVLDP